MTESWGILVGVAGASHTSGGWLFTIAAGDGVANNATGSGGRGQPRPNAVSQLRCGGISTAVSEPNGNA